MKRNFDRISEQRFPKTNLSKLRNSNMNRAALEPEVRNTPLLKTSAPEPMDVENESSANDGGVQWQPANIPKSLRASRSYRNLHRCRTVKTHSVLGVNIPTSPRGSRGRYPLRPVPFPLSRFPSSLFGVLQALGITSAVGLPNQKIQRSDYSAFAAVSTPSHNQRSEYLVSDGARTPLSLHQVKLHPVLGVNVPTRRRESRMPYPRPQVPKLLSLFPEDNCEHW